MMDIDKGGVQRIVKDDRLFDSLMSVANKMIRNWELQGCKRDTEWETASAAVEKEAKIAAIRGFLKELEEIALK